MTISTYVYGQMVNRTFHQIATSFTERSLLQEHFHLRVPEVPCQQRRLNQNWPNFHFLAFILFSPKRFIAERYFEIFGIVKSLINSKMWPKWNETKKTGPMASRISFVPIRTSSDVASKQVKTLFRVILNWIPT